MSARRDKDGKKNTIYQSSIRIEHKNYYIALQMNTMNKRTVKFECKTDGYVSWI